jgi:hypothetical protein
MPKELENRLLDILMDGIDIKQQSQDEDLKYVKDKNQYAIIISRHLIRKDNDREIKTKTRLLAGLLLDAALDRDLFNARSAANKDLADAITIDLMMTCGIRSPSMLEHKWRKSAELGED